MPFALAMVAAVRSAGAAGPSLIPDPRCDTVDFTGDQFETEPWAAGTARQCAACSPECDPTHYTKVECTETRDRVCELISSCVPDGLTVRGSYADGVFLCLRCVACAMWCMLHARRVIPRVPRAR